MISSASFPQQLEYSQENEISKKTSPKETTISTDLIQLINDQENVDYKKIHDSIKNSYLDKKSSDFDYHLEETYLVNNPEFINIYETNKKNKKSIHNSTMTKKTIQKTKLSKITERTLFFMCYDELKAFKIGQNGFECEEIEEEESFLGNSLSGIHFYKHLDVMLKYEYSKKNRPKELYCIIAKAFYDPAKLKQFNPYIKDNQKINGDQNFDGHVAFLKHKSEDDVNKIISALYKESAIYLYELDAITLKHLNKPGNLRPHAIIKYKLKPLLEDIKHTCTDSLHICNMHSELNIDQQQNQQVVESNDLNSRFNQNLKEYIQEYTKYFKDTEEKLPKWRIIYEKTNNMNPIFRGSRRMECKLKNIKYLGLKYSDKDTSMINVNNSTNKLILTYESKRIKKSSLLFNSNPVLSTSEETDTIKKITYVRKTDTGDSTNKKTLIRTSPNDFVHVDLSYFPTIETNKTVQILNNEATKIDKTQFKKTVSISSKPSTINNKPINKIQPESNPNQPSISNTKPKQSSNINIVKDSSNLKPKLSENISKESLERSKLPPKKKVFTNATSNETNSQVPAVLKKSSSSTAKAQVNNSSSLSSDNTALEKRLLGIDKAKSITAKSSVESKSNPTSIGQKTTTESHPSNPTNLLTQPPARSNNIKEDLKKVLEKYRPKTVTSTNKQQQPQQLNNDKQQEKIDKTNQLIESIKSSAKRKKSFWDPDSDTEYDRLTRNSNDNYSLTRQAQEDDDEDDLDDDIVIVSKQNLNLPPVQYSKQFYDLNINGLEAELRKFSPATSLSSCSSSPVNNNNISNTISNNTVTIVTKSPIKTKNKALQLQQQQQISRRSQLNRIANRQRFVHHIIVNNVNNSSLSVENQFDVDGLKNLRSVNQSKSHLSLINAQVNGGGHTIEIHAGGFRCIEEHNFQQSISYLRRTKSFEARKLNNETSMIKTMSFNHSETEQNLKKISLNDYVKTRCSSSATSCISNSSSAPLNPVPQDVTPENKTGSTTELSNSQPLRQSIESTVLSTLNTSNKKIELPSLSLMDELKKRINMKRDESQQRLIREDDLYDDDELKRIQSRHSKLKRANSSTHHKKKSKKKIKLNSLARESSQLSSPDSNLSSQNLDDFDENNSISSFNSSELLLTDDNNLSLSDSSLSSFSSFSSVTSSSSEAAKTTAKKNKHKKSRTKKRKTTSEYDEPSENKLSKKSKSDHRKKKSKHSKRKEKLKTSINHENISDMNENSTQSSNTNKQLLITNDEDYSIEIGDLNVINTLASDDLTTEKKLESKSELKEIETDASSNTNDRNKLTEEKSIKVKAKLTDNYDNFYSEYDIDDSAFLGATLQSSVSKSPTNSEKVSLKMNETTLVDEEKERSQLFIKNESDKEIFNESNLDKNILSVVSEKPQGLFAAATPNSSITTPKPNKQLTPKPQTNFSLTTPSTQSPRTVITPKMGSSSLISNNNNRINSKLNNSININDNHYNQQSYSATAGRSQIKLTPTFPMNQQSIHGPKLQRNNRPDFYNDRQTISNIPASAEFSNNIHDQSSYLMPDTLNYMTSDYDRPFINQMNNGNQMPQGIYNQNKMNNYDYNYSDYQYSNTNTNYQYQKHNFQHSNSNFPWQGNNYNSNYNSGFSNFNHSRNQQRNFNNNNNSRHNNINVIYGNNKNNNNNNNRRSYNPDQEDGEIVD